MSSIKVPPSEAAAAIFHNVMQADDDRGLVAFEMQLDKHPGLPKYSRFSRLAGR